MSLDCVTAPLQALRNLPDSLDYHYRRRWISYLRNESFVFLVNLPFMTVNEFGNEMSCHEFEDLEPCISFRDPHSHNHTEILHEGSLWLQCKVYVDFFNDPQEKVADNYHTCSVSMGLCAIGRAWMDCDNPLDVLTTFSLMEIQRAERILGAWDVVLMESCWSSTL